MNLDKNGIKHGIDSVAERLKDAVDKIADKANESREKISDSVNEMANKTGDEMIQQGHKIKNAAHRHAGDTTSEKKPDADSGN